MIYTKEEALILVREWICNLPSDVKSVTYSIMLYNSLARCDYIPGVSDIDMQIILRTKEAIEKLSSYHMSFCESNNLSHRWLSHEIASKKDLYFDLWMFTIDDLPDPSTRREGIPYFRELWTHDFIKNAFLFFGEDIRGRLQPPPIKESAPIALRKISQWWDKYYGSIQDGELTKDILYLNVPTFLTYIRSALIALVVSLGCDDWRKTTLIGNLHRYAPNFSRLTEAEEAMKFALNPKEIKSLDLSKIKELLRKYRILLDEIVGFLEIRNEDKIKKNPKTKTQLFRDK